MHGHREPQLDRFVLNARCCHSAAARREQMSHQTERIAGSAQKVGGKIKKQVGRALGNNRMEAEGRAKELNGKARVETSKLGERTKGKIEEVTGKLKNQLGHLIGNQQMMAEGKGRELKGEGRQKVNK
jgi:uncharacterized protein YjbJ (UPF0337 family)